MKKIIKTLSLSIFALSIIICGNYSNASAAVKSASKTSASLFWKASGGILVPVTIALEAKNILTYEQISLDYIRTSTLDVTGRIYKNYQFAFVVFPEKAEFINNGTVVESTTSFNSGSYIYDPSYYNGGGYWSIVRTVSPGSGYSFEGTAMGYDAGDGWWLISTPHLDV